MNLKQFSDEILIEKTDRLVREEREILTSLLYHFKEIDRRRAYSPKYKSLIHMLTEHFKYSNDQAYYRFSAMRLLADLPEVEEKITSGELSLTQLTQARTLFRQEKKLGAELNKAEQLEVLEKIAGTSTRETERIMLALSSAPLELKPDSVKAVSADYVELKFVADNETLEMIEKLKGLMAHKNPNMTLGELFKELAKLGIEKHDPAKIVVRKTKRPKKFGAPQKTGNGDKTSKSNENPAAMKKTESIRQRVHQPVHQVSGAGSSEVGSVAT